jgi:hypothetical protein
VAIPKKAFVVSTAVAVTALGAAVGVSSLASAGPTPTPTPSGTPSAGTPDSTPTKAGDGPGHRMRGEQFAQELAGKFGVPQDDVATALGEIREENQPTSRPDPSQLPDPAERDAALAKSLAEKLNIDEAKVTAALDELRSERQAARAAALEERLDAAVTAGTLTQAEADAVQKAVDKGVIHAGR